MYFDGFFRILRDYVVIRKTFRIMMKILPGIFETVTARDQGPLEENLIPAQDGISFLAALKSSPRYSHCHENRFPSLPFRTQPDRPICLLKKARKTDLQLQVLREGFDWSLAPVSVLLRRSRLYAIAKRWASFRIS
jgi:hypothetical protein